MRNSKNGCIFVTVKGNKNTNTIKTITFISHYNTIRVNVKLSDDKADAVLNNKYGYSAIELYATDCDRMAAGYLPQYFSKSQIHRLNSSLLGTDYFDAVEVK